MINTKDLHNMIKAAAIHAGKKDLRYYLNGIHCQVSNNKIQISASDGNRLIRFTTRIDCTSEYDFIICNKAVKILLALLNDAHELSNVEIVKHDIESSVLLNIDGKEYPITLIGATFPSLDRVLNNFNDSPAEAVNDIGLNIDFIADVSKALKYFKRKFNVLKFNFKGHKLGVHYSVNINDIDVIGLIMPCKL